MMKKLTKKSYSLESLKIKAYKSLIAEVSKDLEKILEDPESSLLRLENLKIKIDGFL